MITEIRKKGFSVLLCAGMVAFSTSCFAGFEFTAPVTTQAAAPPTTAPAQMQPRSLDGSMPVIPSMPVSAEPLAAPAEDRVLSSPVSHSVEPVYIKRQRKEIPLKPAANEAVNTQALLDATNNMQPVSIAPAAAPANSSGRLVIDPYPLQVKNAPTARGGTMGGLSVEQAMMEQTGMLRPVAVPGQTGQTDRARISSRYDSNPQEQYLDRATVVPREPVSLAAPSLSSNITPIPGGEGAPIAEMQRMPRPAPIFAARTSRVIPEGPMQAPAPAAPVMAAQQPMTLLQQNDAGFPEAVGFGRDLPLALALSQVIPPEYSYAFGHDVNAGATVSWQGGRPWNEVLNEMLAPAGMKALIQSGQVTIQSASS